MLVWNTNMIPKSIFSILKAASKFAKAGGGSRMRFESLRSRRSSMDKMPGTGPIMSIAKATFKGPMSRREFLGRSGKITNELRMQRNLAKAAYDIKNQQVRANTWLTSSDTINKIKQYNIDIAGLYKHGNTYKWGIDKKQDAFRKKLGKSLRRSEGEFEYPWRRAMNAEKANKPPKDPGGRWFFWRERLARKYGHAAGTGSYLNKTFDWPKPSVKDYYKTLNLEELHEMPHEGIWMQGSKGILRYIDALKNQNKRNPILDAFKEGLYG